SGSATRGLADVWVCTATILAGARVDRGGGRRWFGAGGGPARFVGCGGRATRFGWGGFDRPPIAGCAAVAGRSCGGRGGAVSGGGFGGVGDPCRRRGRLFGGGGADVVGPVGVAFDGRGAGSGGG